MLTPGKAAARVAPVSGDKGRHGRNRHGDVSMTFSPASACASGMLSRTCHRPCVCSSFSHHGVADQPCCRADLQQVLQGLLRRFGCVITTECSGSVHHGAVLASGRRATAGNGAAPAAAVAFISSKPVRPASGRLRASASRVIHGRLHRWQRAAKAVTCVQGSGNSFRGWRR